MPKVSVVIPMYNAERFVERCLDSILLRGLADVEVVCVDDGSPDRSAEIVEQYAARDNRIRLIRQENRGPGGARNTGIEASTGEYLAFIDPDDYVSDDYFGQLYSAAKRHDADIATASLLLVSDRKGNIYCVENTEERLFTSLNDRFKGCLAPPDFHSTNKIYRASIIKENNIRYPAHSICEDVGFMTDALLAARSVLTVTTATYWYIQNNQSITRSRQTAKKQEDKYRSFKEMIRVLDAAGVEYPDRYRRLRKRTYSLGCVTLLKIREYRNVQTWLLFDFIPIHKKKLNPDE